MTEEYTNTDVTNWINQVSFTKLPPAFNMMRSPWRVSSRVDKAGTINRLLAHSFVVQSSTIPFPVTHPNLPFFILSNSCIQICNLMKYYLAHLQMEAEVHCGALKMDDIQGIMHVFLEIGGEIVDNTYVHSEVLLLSLLLFPKFSLFEGKRFCSDKSGQLPDGIWPHAEKSGEIRQEASE